MSIITYKMMKLIARKKTIYFADFVVYVRLTTERAINNKLAHLASYTT